MENYRGNSFSSRSIDEEKRKEKIIEGTAKVRTKTSSSKLLDLLLPDDISNIKKYILLDVIIPGIKNILGNSFDVMLNGQTHRPISPSTQSRTSYERYYFNKTPVMAQPSEYRRGDIVEEIIFETKADALSVLDNMDECIDKFRVVRVSDLYEFAGISDVPHTANKYGWIDLRNAEVMRLRDGTYTIKFPTPKQID